MKWKKRQKEIARLRRKHAGMSSVASIPTLMQPGERSPPSLTSTGVCKILESKRQPREAPKNLIVDTLHKQGPMVLSRSELPWAGGRKS